MASSPGPGAKLQTPNSKLQTPNSKLKTQNSKLQTPNSKLQTPNFKLQTPISKLQSPNSKLHIVTGFVNDKDVDKVLPLFPAAAQYYFAKADIPRGLEATVLQEKAARFGLRGKAYVSVKNALSAAKRAAAPSDLIIVTGSIFVVAETL